MDNSIEIEKFVPPAYKKRKIDYRKLSLFWGKSPIYATKGRWALYHILKSLKVNKKILLPVYICDTVLVPLKKLRIKPYFYDLDKRDLNASIESVDFMLKKSKAEAVLVASMYGNPADLLAIEKLCKNQRVMLIDDAAQSFGAELNGKKVGTFGDAGFFSFSPGKPTAGHQGAFFWTKNEEYSICRTRNHFFHFISYLNFYFNRLHIYTYKKYKIFKLFSLTERILNRLLNIKNDDICRFEEKQLGGILHAILNDEFSFRKQISEEFAHRFSNIDRFKMVRAIRGINSPHKLVLIFDDEKKAMHLMQYLRERNIVSLNGYRMPTSNFSYLPNARTIRNCVVELPIEKSEKKMAYLFNEIEAFIKEH